MKDYAKINKDWWNNVTQIHSRSKLYNLEGFKKGKTSLFTIEQEELQDVKGKNMLHLMCHFGLDTLSWARVGAKVTGVDLSDKSIKLARKLSREENIPAKFICSDIYDLPKILNQKYEIIYMSYGVLCWIRNIRKWAKLINYYLEKGGIFYIVELHPFTNILSYDFKLHYKYFDKGPYLDDSEGTYADWNSKTVYGYTYEWSYTMGDVINSLIKEGLRIDFVHEFPFTMYDQFPGFMEKNRKGEYFLANKRMQLPLLFSLKATKI